MCRSPSGEKNNKKEHARVVYAVARSFSCLYLRGSCFAYIDARVGRLSLNPAMAEQRKFSLVKAVAGNKRTESSQQSAAAKKIPKVSEMTPVEARPQKIVTNAPVVVCVYPVIMCGKYTWSLQEQTKLVKCVVIVCVLHSSNNQSGPRAIPHSR